MPWRKYIMTLLRRKVTGGTGKSVYLLALTVFIKTVTAVCYNHYVLYARYGVLYTVAV